MVTMIAIQILTLISGQSFASETLSCIQAEAEAQTALQNGFSNPCGIAPAEAFCPGSHRHILNPFSAYYGFRDTQEALADPTASPLTGPRSTRAHSLACKLYLLHKAERASARIGSILESNLGGLVPESFVQLRAQLQGQMDAIRTCSMTASSTGTGDIGLAVLEESGIRLSDAMLSGTTESDARRAAGRAYCAIATRALFPNGFATPGESSTPQPAPRPTSTASVENGPTAPVISPPAQPSTPPTETLRGEQQLDDQPFSSVRNTFFTSCEGFEPNSNSPSSTARVDRGALHSRLRFAEPDSAVVLFARDGAVVQWIDLGEATTTTLVPAEDIAWLRQELASLRSVGQVRLRTACVDRRLTTDSCAAQDAAMRLAPRLLPGVNGR